MPVQAEEEEVNGKMETIFADDFDWRYHGKSRLTDDLNFKNLISKMSA